MNAINAKGIEKNLVFLTVKKGKPGKKEQLETQNGHVLMFPYK